MEWKPFNAAAADISDVMDPAIFHMEQELYSYTMCVDCSPIVAALEQPNAVDPLTIFTSHINPSVIQSSSHPHVMPISKYLRHPLHAPIQPFVSHDLNEGFSIARSWFQQATYVLVLAGAGMSADSGLSVFRYQLIPSGSSGSSSSSSGSSGSSSSNSERNSSSSTQTKSNSSTLAPTATTTATTTTATATTSAAATASAAVVTTKPLSLLGGGLTTEEVDYRAHPEKAW